jgi:multidrug resistance efflux pump
LISDLVKFVQVKSRLLDKQAGIIVVELIVVHVPKTAGVTFQTILNQIYGTQHIYYDYEESSIPRVYKPADIPSEFRAIHGHFPINKYDNFFPDAKRIIWLRHPIYLLISLYFYWRNIPAVSPDDNSIVGKIQRTKMGLYEFAEQPEVRNILCQNICGRKLTNFYFIGLQEFFTQDLAELKTLLGWPAFHIGQANINPNLKYEDDLQEVFANKTIINKLVENNRADLELYQEALNLRAKRCQESSFLQPVLGEWNRAQYRIRQILKGANVLENSSCIGTGKTAMNEWKKTFLFKRNNLPYNRILYNNPTERSVEVSIGLDFLDGVKKSERVLEVGNVISYYENLLSERVGVINRKILDKFEIDIGVDNEDLMNLPSEEKYDAIVSVSTVEHIGQGVDPSGAYGESTDSRDLEAPLKAIAKIYDLLAVEGKALITVPFGVLTDGGWYIQFSAQYLTLLNKYGIPQEAIRTSFLKLINRDPTKDSVKMLWEEVEERELSNVEYNYPFPCANAIAVIELSKLSNEFYLNLNVAPTPLSYHMPYETRLELSQYKAQLQQIQDEQAQLQSQLHQTKKELELSQVLLHQAQSGFAQSQTQMHQTQGELEQCQTQLHQTQGELEQCQTQLHQTQGELEQCQTQLHQTQGELEQCQTQLHQTQGELEQSQVLLYQAQSGFAQSQTQLHQTQGELEQSQAQLHQTQGELEQSQAQLHQTQGELEQSQAQLHQTQGELEQSQAQLHQTQGELEQSQTQLHQTQGELEQSQTQLHQTQGELEQSQAQLHQTQGELEQSQTQLHQTQGELEQSQTQLHQTQEELEQSQAQLHQTQGELERLKFQPLAPRQPDAQSKTQYECLLWEAWFAYHKGDLKGMAHFLKESFKCTPFSPTETVLNWLESLAHFSSDKGYNLDTNSLINSVEWKELTRHTLTTGKVTLSRL